MGNGKPLHSLVDLSEFKALMGIDDREDAYYPQGSLCTFVLVSSTYTIEHYCRRRLLKKKCLEYPEFSGSYLFSLREYPVREIRKVYQINSGFAEPKLIEPINYHLIPDKDSLEEYPYCLSLNPKLGLHRGQGTVKVYYTVGLSDSSVTEDFIEPHATLNLRPGTRLRVEYWAGYQINEVPADLKSAAFELAAWNLNRYRGKRIGMTGVVRGKGQDGEHLEPSIPENVRLLLEPYRRVTL
ncbi:hypothetical protein FACS189468_8820 [Spirochaetia bacterium]|nr:hypothetical protein FACS189468_8820 [Spirochaetia bacterium]